MRHRWLLTLLIVAGVTLLCRLGFWQLSRAEEKQQWLLQWQTQQHAVLSQTDLNNTKPSMRYARVKLSGHFLNDRTVLLDNKTNKGQPGYHVLVPLQLDNQILILVDRGFIPLPRSRKILPTILPILGETTIEGYLDFEYRNPFIGRSIETQIIDWPLRIQQLDWEHMSTLLGNPVFPMLVKFDTPNPLSFQLPVATTEWLTPDRHYGYACQWFLLALTLATLYGFFYFQQVRRGKS